MTLNLAYYSFLLGQSFHYLTKEPNPTDYSHPNLTTIMDSFSPFLFLILLLASNVWTISADSTTRHYIVLFNSTSSADVQNAVASLPIISTVYSTPPHLEGFSAMLQETDVRDLAETYPDILIEPVTTVQAGTIVGRIDGPWGLQRISSLDTVYGDPDRLNYTYWFNFSYDLGAGIDIYIIDTGINAEHLAFGGRAANLYPPGSNATDDSNGVSDQFPFHFA